METEAQYSTRSRGIALTALAIILIAVYLASGNGRFHNIDEVSIFALTQNLAKRGALDVNEITWTQWALAPAAGLEAFGSQGDVFAKKGPAPAFLAVPLYWVGWRLGLPVISVTLWFNALVTAWTALLVGQTALTLGYKLRTAMLAGLAFGLGTIAWQYARQFFGEPTAALGLTGACWGLIHWRKTGNDFAAAGAGLAAGAMIATNAAMGVLLAPLSIYLLYAIARPEFSTEPAPSLRARAIKTLVAFGFPLVTIMGLVVYYNWIRFASLFYTGYHFELGEGFTNDLALGLWGLLVSPYKGFFWFTPLALGSFYSFPGFLRRHRVEGWLLASISVMTIVLFAKWWIWWGAVSWGPRFLVPPVSLWVILLLPSLDALDWRDMKPRALIVLLAISVFVQILAVSVNYLNFENVLAKTYQSDWYDLIRTGPPALYNPMDSPILGQIGVGLSDPIGNSDLGWIRRGEINPLVPFLGLGAVILGVVAYRRTRWSWLGGAAVLLAVLAVTSAQFYATHPEFGNPNRDYAAALADVSRRAGPQDGIVTIAPLRYLAPMAHYRGALPIYGFATDEVPLHKETEMQLARALERHPRIWLITVGLLPADASNGVEAYLARRAFKADDQWFDDARLAVFVTGAPYRTIPLGVKLGERVQLVSATIGDAIQPRRTLAVELNWEASGRLLDLRGFAQLLDAQGKLIAGQDDVPGGGYAPSATWQLETRVNDRRGLLLPANLAPGAYTLIAGLYDAASGVRLKTADGRDYIVLTTFTLP